MSKKILIRVPSYCWIEVDIAMAHKLATATYYHDDYVSGKGYIYYPADTNPEPEIKVVDDFRIFPAKPAQEEVTE